MENTTTIQRLDGPFKLKIGRESLSISHVNASMEAIKVFSYPIYCAGATPIPTGYSKL